MKKTKNNQNEKTMTFNEFDQSKGETEDYPPPAYIVKPAKGDKGYALVNAALNKNKNN